MMRRILAIALLAAVALPGVVQAATWRIDPVHSSTTFKIRHIFSKVTGEFNEFSGTITFDPADPTKGSVDALINAASINTKNEKRDAHLNSPDFFNVAEHPNITFKSTKVEKSESGLKVSGDLTMRGVTKPVVLDVEILGTGPHPSIPQGQAAGFTARTTVNRQDFGIQWNKVLDQGGSLLGDEVEIVIDIEAVSAPES